ncbi:unnamed protein product [Ascophyllum nodosum]
MDLGEHPRKFLLRVDQMAKELERVDRPVDPKDIDIVILSGLTPQYDAEVCMLESSSDWPTREWIERAVINQYERPKCEKSAAGSRVMLSARGYRRNDKLPIRCPLCSRIGRSALQCREFQITRRDKKPNGYQRNGEPGGNGGGGENGGGGDDNRRGGGYKNRSGGGETGLLEIEARRRADLKEPQTLLTTARSMVTARVNPRHIMEFHRLLGHPSEEITRRTVRMSGVPLTGTWTPCVHCSESRVRRYAESKSTESHTNERAERFVIDITGPLRMTSRGGNRYAILCVDDFTRFNFICFLKHKSDTAKELREIVVEHIDLTSIKIGTVRADGGEEFEGEFPSLLKNLGIKRETTPPHTPQYNGVVEWALGLL